MNATKRILRAWDDNRLCWVELEVVPGNTGPLPGDICWRETRRDVDSVVPTYEQILDRVIDEQVNLWGDLNHAVAYAVVDPPVIPGHWSIRCDEVASRIAKNAILVGPIHWEHVQVDLLLAGIYQKILHVVGLDWPPIDWDAVRSLHDRVKAPLGVTWPGPPVDLLDVNPDWNPL